jgi:hypothetical protein
MCDKNQPLSVDKQELCYSSEDTGVGDIVLSTGEMTLHHQHGRAVMLPVLNESGFSAEDIPPTQQAYSGTQKTSTGPPALLPLQATGVYSARSSSKCPYPKLLTPAPYLCDATEIYVSEPAAPLRIGGTQKLLQNFSQSPFTRLTTGYHPKTLPSEYTEAAPAGLLGRQGSMLQTRPVNRHSLPQAANQKGLTGEYMLPHAGLYAASMRNSHAIQDIEEIAIVNPEHLASPLDSQRMMLS